MWLSIVLPKYPFGTKNTRHKLDVGYNIKKRKIPQKYHTNIEIIYSYGNCMAFLYGITIACDCCKVECTKHYIDECAHSKLFSHLPIIIFILNSWSAGVFTMCHSHEDMMACILPFHTQIEACTCDIFCAFQPTRLGKFLFSFSYSPGWIWGPSF